jgi:hypothetical protein
MKNNRLRLWLIISFFIAFLIVTGDRLANIVEPGKHGMDKKSMREMLGTFKDPAGKEGNFITFELVPNPIKSDSPAGLAQALKGDGHLHQLFGYEDMGFVWGYNEWDPVLKITIVPKLTPLTVEPTGRLGVLEVSAISHSLLKLRVLNSAVPTNRVKDVFEKGQTTLSLTRTKEPRYRPPNF